MGFLVDADPVPAALAHLTASTRLAAELGGAGRVGAEHIPPYPRLRVQTIPGGSDDLLTGESTVLLRLEALDSLEAPVGTFRLRRILYAALTELADLPAVPAGEGEVVITNVEAQGVGPVAEADGRSRYLATAVISCHAG
ncbi:hypothetical protein [Planomonospora sp. ID82291]|uniref:hypothetical protein n=1 Tax=Planomonospora sp. ID82291 TaxID=2738136 RepID=UPI0018C3CB9C|nr:hypothetical protein [Planomonospora sp. ID82291]MBG0818991.1 hypothetical protein [Planomonospora sp. ID82291]